MNRLEWSVKWADLSGRLSQQTKSADLVEADLVEATDLVKEKKSSDLVEVTSGWGKNRSVEPTSKSK